MFVKTIVFNVDNCLRSRNLLGQPCARCFFGV